MVRRLCCRVDHFSCWSVSPAFEVFRCLFSTKRAVLLWTFSRLEICLSLRGSHTAHAHTVMGRIKLQALVYDILPSATAVFRRLFDVAMLLTRPVQIKQKSVESKRNSFFFFLFSFFLPGVDASHIYVRAWVLAVASTVLLVPKSFGGR